GPSILWLSSGWTVDLRGDQGLVRGVLNPDWYLPLNDRNKDGTFKTSKQVHQEMQVEIRGYAQEHPFPTNRLWVVVLYGLALWTSMFILSLPVRWFGGAWFLMSLPLINPNVGRHLETIALSNFGLFFFHATSFKWVLNILATGMAGLVARRW